MACLFVAIGKQLGIDHASVRRDVCDYLTRNGSVLEGVQTKDLVDKDYIKAMAQTSTWGSAIEIQAACSIYHVRIAVLSTRPRDRKTPIVFTPVGGRLYHRTLFLTWNGSHFEPASPMLLPTT